MSVGERISQLRMQKNMTQSDLARAMEVSRQAVSKWENGQTVPDSMKMLKLVDVLDTDLEYLTTGRIVVPTRPPVVVKSVETVEKIVEKPVVQIVERVVERKVEVPVEVPVVQYVEKPVIRKVERIKYVRNPIEFVIVGVGSFLIGLLIGIILR